MVLPSITSRRPTVHHFHPLAFILVPLIALIVQASLPTYHNVASVLNLPLLVVIYFAFSSRSPGAGLVMGLLIGLVQDSLSGEPIGLSGIANTIIGYSASLVGLRMDTETGILRFIIVFVFYNLYLLFRFILGSVLPGITFEPALAGSLVAALVNGIIGMILFELLDRFRKPA